MQGSGPADADTSRAILNEIVDDRKRRESGTQWRNGWLILVFSVFVAAVILNVLNARLQYAYLWDFFEAKKRVCHPSGAGGMTPLTAWRMVATMQFPWFAGFVWPAFLNRATPFFLDLLITSGIIDDEPDCLCSSVCESEARCMNFWKSLSNWGNRDNPFFLIIPPEADILRNYINGTDPFTAAQLVRNGFIAVAEGHSNWSLAQLWNYCFAQPEPPSGPGCGTAGSELAGDIMSNAISGGFLGVTAGGLGGPWGAGLGLVGGMLAGAAGGYALNRMKRKECGGG